MRSHKYNACRTEFRGVVYDSQAEAARAAELYLLERGGAVQGVLRQVRVPLGPDFATVVDFLVLAADGDAQRPRCWVEEVKGVETPQFKKVRSLWAKYGPCRMDLYHVSGGKGRRVETIPGATGASREGE